ncbi:MAG TPA: TPM domain-containing protein [Burkholderiales bacterium]|nr:TPM domain-containing protein [Burkholderiales bacterium]
MVRRALKHLFTPDWVARRAFPPHTLRALEQAIRDSEIKHRGEIRFAIEAGLSPAHLRISTRERARQVFAQLGVWDTEENSGVLVYVQLVDRRIEIVADRGIAQRVAQAEWDAVCRAMERAFKRRDYQTGSLAAVGTVTDILARHFPASGANPNELPDKPALL